jgi:hypothetical protein
MLDYDLPLPDELERAIGSIQERARYQNNGVRLI